AAPADHVFGFGELDSAAADILIARPNGIRDAIERNAECLQLLRIDHDLILALEAADTRDFGDAFGGDELITHKPILDAAQLGERALRTEHHIFINPADAARVRAKRGRDAFGQPLRGKVQIFEHATTCPIEIDAIVKYDVDERHREIREAAHDAS